MTRRLGEVRRLGFALVLAMAVTGSADAEPDGLRRALDRQQQDLKTQSDENRHRLDSQQQQLHQQQEGALRFQLRQQDRPFQPTPAPPPSQPPSITCTQVGETFFCPSASIGPNGGANNVAKVWITLVLSGNTLYERTVLIKFEQEVCGQAEKEASRPGFQGQRPRLPH